MSHGLEGPGAVSPVFVAGCEAISTSQRMYFSSWLQAAFEKTGFTRFQRIKEIMAEVWARRDDNHEGKDWTWIHICREKSQYIMLV